MLEEGRLVEVGNHTDLVERDGPYAHFVGAYKRMLA
jgi:ABC-type transport system involved in Fe-S cluster assembly fused permease/ATPase subunit